MHLLRRSPCYIIVIFLAWLASGSSKITRDWKTHPAVVDIDAPDDIWAIGDVHGDYERLAAVLKTAGLIAAEPDRPEDVKWTGGNAVLVVTGDMIDKGPHSLDVLRLLHALVAAEKPAGGRAVILMGNHEAEFLAEPHGSKSSEFRKELNEAHLDPKEVALCQSDIGDFLCGLPMAAKVRDWFFCHGGFSAGRSLAKLRADLEAGVDREGFATEQLIGPNSLLEARLTLKKGEGAQWVDAGRPADRPAQLLANCARRLEVNHIVQGHQPSTIKFSDGLQREAGEMYQRDGLLFLIDVGMSRGVADSHGAALHITRRADGVTEASAVCFNGKTTALWDSAHKPLVGRAAPCRP